MYKKLIFPEPIVPISTDYSIVEMILKLDGKVENLTTQVELLKSLIIDETEEK